MNYLILTIIKAFSIPGRMISLSPTMKKLMSSSIKTAQSFHFIFYSMRMDDIHDNFKAISMGLINKCFQIIGGTEARRRGKKIRNLIPKRTIVRVLLNGHNL